MLIKKADICIIVVLLLSSIAVISPIASVAGVDETYVSVINPADGTTDFNYTNVDPPPTATDYPLGYVLANITVTNVADLAGYQVNLTWDPSLLKIASSSDVYLPSDHIFEGLNPVWVPPSIDNTIGYLGAVCARGYGATTFTGSGTMFQVKFNVTKVPGMGETLSCNLAFGLAGTFPTVLKDHLLSPITFTPQNGYYQYRRLADNIPPVIGTPTRVPEGDVEPSQNVTVSVNVTDAGSGVENVTLHYTLDNGTTWEEPVLMNYNTSTSLYEATIPRQPADTWVKFKIVAYDTVGNNATKDGTETYCVYQVIPEFQLAILLPLLMIATLIAVALPRYKHLKKKARQ